jgi:YggT family protein
VDVVRLVVYYLLFFFWLPVGGVAIALESVYTMTDPPVRALRRVVKPIRIGGVGLDLSIMVLLLVVFILMRVIDPRT